MQFAAAVLLIVAATVGVVSPGRARACSLSGTPPHTIDPAMVGVDQTPPLLPMPVVREIYRHDEGGCDGTTSSCGDLTIVNLTNLATDDMTPIHKIGYRLTLISGTGFTPVDGTFDAPFDGSAF